MKVKKIIIRYLEMYPGRIVSNHTFQTELPDFGRSIYGFQHTPETYSRTWRILRRNNNEELLKYGFSVIETDIAGSREKHFVIRRANEVYRDSTGSTEQERSDNTSYRIEKVHQA